MAKSVIKEYLETLIIAGILAWIIITFFIQAFTIPSGSMMDTLLVGDYVLVNKFLYGIRIPFTPRRVLPIRQPQRRDIIVFRAPLEPRDFIKRIVALPGEEVQIREGRVYINGWPVDEPYIKEKPEVDFGPVRVPPTSYFVLGDNRNRSADSRVWGFVPKENIRGKAMIIYWSWNKERNRPRFSRIGRIVR